MKRFASSALILALLISLFFPVQALACEKCVFVLFVGWMCDKFAECGWDGCVMGSDGKCFHTGGECGPYTCADSPGLTAIDDSAFAFTSLGADDPLAPQPVGISPLNAEAASCGQLIY